MPASQLKKGDPFRRRPALEIRDDLRGIKRQRRYPLEAKQSIFELIDRRPLRPKDLQRLTGYSSVHVWRYCKVLEKAGKIEKQGLYWKKRGAPEDLIARQRIEDLVDDSYFLQLPILEDFIRHCRGFSGGLGFLSKFRSICTGKVVPGFKCHPNNWTAETTKQFILAYQDLKNETRLSYNLRQLLRYVHEYVLHKSISEADKERLGLDGACDRTGLYNHVHLTEPQIASLGKFYLDKGDLEAAAYVRGGIEVFGRPKAWYLAEIAKFEPVEKQVALAHVDGFDQPITDPKMHMLLRLLSATSPNLKVSFEYFKQTQIHGRLFEGKTAVTWPKRIRDPEAVKIVLEYMKQHNMKPYFFRTEGESWSKFRDRMTKTLREGYRDIEIKDEYFYRKPLYTLRHCGAHLWLRRTGYNYGLVAAMGWENVQILKKWYGGFDESELDRQVLT